jgi:plastocyanin
VPWPAGDNGAWFFSPSDSSFTIPGPYVFRARVLDPATGAATEWSPGTTVKMKCCHSQVREGGFYPGFSVSVLGSPFVWRVQDDSGHTYAVRDASPLRLYHSAVLTNGQSYSHTLKGAGSYPVLDSVRGFTSRVLVRPQASTLFGSVGKPITITAATERPNVAWREWQIQIRRPGEPEFHPWRIGTKAECLPQHAGQYLFRARLYDRRLGHGVAWSPALTVRVAIA